MGEVERVQYVAATETKQTPGSNLRTDRLSIDRFAASVHVGSNVEYDLVFRHEEVVGRHALQHIGNAVRSEKDRTYDRAFRWLVGNDGVIHLASSPAR